MTDRSETAYSTGGEYTGALPLLDQLFEGRPLSDFARPLPGTTDPLAARLAMFEAADLAHDINPDFPLPPELRPNRYELLRTALRWSALDRDLSALRATNDSVRKRNQEQAQNREALAQWQEQRRRSIGGCALGRLFGDTFGYRGQLPASYDLVEYAIPEITEPAIVGDGLLYHRQKQVAADHSSGLGDTLTVTEVGLDATLSVGEHGFNFSLQNQGSMVTVHNAIHDEEGYRCGEVTWYYFPTQGRVQKTGQSGRWNQLRPSEETQFGYYITDYTSDAATLQQILELVARQ